MEIAKIVSKSMRYSVT